MPAKIDKWAVALEQPWAEWILSGFSFSYPSKTILPHSGPVFIYALGFDKKIVQHSPYPDHHIIRKWYNKFTICNAGAKLPTLQFVGAAILYDFNDLPPPSPFRYPPSPFYMRFCDPVRLSHHISMVLHKYLSRRAVFVPPFDNDDIHQSDRVLIDKLFSKARDLGFDNSEKLVYPESLPSVNE